MKKNNILERFKESPSGLFKSLIGQSLTMLKSTAIDNLQNGNFDAYGRLCLVIDDKKSLEFTTQTRLAINTEYNVTQIETFNISADLDSLKDFAIAQPFTVSKIFIYGETLSFIDIFGSMAYDRLDDKNKEKENLMNVDTEDIVIFESTDNKKIMILTPQSPYFQVIFDEAKMTDIIENWKYPNLGKDEKMYKLKRVID